MKKIIKNLMGIALGLILSVTCGSTIVHAAPAPSLTSVSITDVTADQNDKGARASALVYSISETAKLNNLRPYYYFRHILTELPKYCDEKGNINPAKLDQLMPWAEELPEECRKPRRS